MFTRTTRGTSLEIDQSSCTGCLRCVRYCRRRALGITHRDGEPRPTIVALDRCKYCGKCARVCPSGAITLSPARAGHAETAATNAGILLIVAALVVAALVLLREGVEIFIT